MKQTLLYSLKIWLTSVVVGPALYGIFDALTRPNFLHNLTGVAGFYLYSLPYGLILSIPSWLLFWLLLHSLNMLRWNWVTTRVLFSIVAVILTLAPFILLFGADDPAGNETFLAWPMAYCFVLIAGIWFYKLRKVSDPM